MTVYIVQEYYDYEGTNLKGAYSTHTKALNAAKKYVKRCGGTWPAKGGDAWRHKHGWGVEVITLKLDKPYEAE